MLPNIKALLTNQPLTGLSARIEKQIQQINSLLPMKSQVLDQVLSNPIPVQPIPPLDSVPIDKNKIAEGYPVAESFDLNLTGEQP